MVVIFVLIEIIHIFKMIWHRLLTNQTCLADECVVKMLTGDLASNVNHVFPPLSEFPVLGFDPRTCQAADGRGPLARVQVGRFYLLTQKSVTDGTHETDVTSSRSPF